MKFFPDETMQKEIVDILTDAQLKSGPIESLYYQAFWIAREAFEESIRRNKGCEDCNKGIYIKDGGLKVVEISKRRFCSFCGKEIDDYVFRLMQSFPKSFVNGHGEFIAHDKANEFFKLSTCIDEAEVKCKVLEWFSRGASKTECFDTKKENKEFRMFMLNGINEFLETKFTGEDMGVIYQMLGNNVNRKLCEEFINGGFNINLLQSGFERQ